MFTLVESDEDKQVRCTIYMPFNNSTRLLHSSFLFWAMPYTFLQEHTTIQAYTLIVIELSTRGTVHSDNWFLRLSDQATPRSYHLLDYG